MEELIGFLIKSESRNTSKERKEHIKLISLNLSDLSRRSKRRIEQAIPGIIKHIKLLKEI